jgi:D-ornithine 4,5-aminomutase subunit beta
MEWSADGIVLVNMFLPLEKRIAEAAAVEFAKKMNLEEIEVINREVMHPAEGTRIELKGRVPGSVDISTLEIPPEPEILSEDELREEITNQPLRIVAATVGEDEHSVGLREILDIKHGGIEKYGIECHYLGTSVPVEKLVDAAIELDAQAILVSTIISHDDIHYTNMKLVHNFAVEKGIRDKLMIVCGGTQVIPEIALRTGIDAAFGRGAKGAQVATFLVKRRKEIRAEQ